MAFNTGALLLAASLMGPLVLAHPALAASGATTLSSIGSEAVGVPKVPCYGGPINRHELGAAPNAFGKLTGTENTKGTFTAGSEFGSLGKEKGSIAGTTQHVYHMRVAIKTKPHLLPQVGLASHSVGVFQGSPVRAIVPLSISGVNHLRIVYHEKANQHVGLGESGTGSAVGICHDLLAALKGRRDVHVTIQSLTSGELRLTLYGTGANVVLGKVILPQELMIRTISRFVASGTVPIQCLQRGEGAVVLRPAIRASGAASAETVHHALKALGSRHRVKTSKAEALPAGRAIGGGAGSGPSSIKPGQIILGATTVHTGLPFGAELAVAGALVALGSGILVRSRRSG